MPHAARTSPRGFTSGIAPPSIIRRPANPPHHPRVPTQPAARGRPRAVPTRARDAPGAPRGCCVRATSARSAALPLPGRQPTPGHPWSFLDSMRARNRTRSPRIGSSRSPSRNANARRRSAGRRSGSWRRAHSASASTTTREPGTICRAASLEARLACYEKAPDLNTWGVCQAYGDPTFVLEPAAAGDGQRRRASHFVCPDEVVDRLRRERSGERSSPT